MRFTNHKKPRLSLLSLSETDLLLMSKRYNTVKWRNCFVFTVYGFTNVCLGTGNVRIRIWVGNCSQNVHTMN